MTSRLAFVQRLTQLMHYALGDKAIVIWYDAVTIEGKLEWYLLDIFILIVVTLLFLIFTSMIAKQAR